MFCVSSLELVNVELRFRFVVSTGLIIDLIRKWWIFHNVTPQSIRSYVQLTLFSTMTRLIAGITNMMFTTLGENIRAGDRTI